MMYLQNTGKFQADNLENTSKDDSNSESRLREAQEKDEIDNKYGFYRVRDNVERIGFLINMHTNELLDDDKRLISIVDYYFIKEDGSRFKVSLPFMPYFYILPRKETMQEIIQFLSKKYAGLITSIDTNFKEDLDLPNHLIGLKQRYLKLSFMNMSDLIKVRRDILSAVKKNREVAKTNTFYTEMLTSVLSGNNQDTNTLKNSNQMENIIDIREYDVPYHVRVSIDKKIFCGLWYKVKVRGSVSETPQIIRCDDLIERPDPIVLAYDIETTKLPLKFPDAATDQIMMISYMIDGQGYLITNREIISCDVDDFEYTPKPEYEGQFTVFNEPNEKSLILKFFEHIMDVRPHIFVTYNGDFFDWPFVEARAAFHELDMKKAIGFAKDRNGVYSCRSAMHMDCFCWVKRDSYLPAGSHNLKAVAKTKLRYDPVELDPEDMCRLATEQPQVLSNYSVSDAVATYYLYMKYVHPFIFALCTIIPMEPDEVLRKGSGTLCEALLMVQAFHANIVFPNKEEHEFNKLTKDGHVLHQETYVGGHVEALEVGVFRADIPCKFRLDTEIFDRLKNEVESTMQYAIEHEEGVPIDMVTNFQEICDDIKQTLTSIQQHPNRVENPKIYHLDVGAMYPNIILTNRLQPSAIVNETVCASCDFNRPNATCQRKMTWTWRGEFMPASRGEYQRIQQQLEIEKFPSQFPGGPQRPFHQLTKEEQANFEKKRLTDYCKKAYKKTKVTRIEERETTICQKENSFYVDTVRDFRDRRYEYKGLSKKAKQLLAEALKTGNAEDIKSAKNREVLYDSLQLAYKCILNSFYGYVMRRGARWHSMEMAGIVCHTGANVIRKAREIVERVGRPLELDTDGIWCVLPASFPDTFKFLSTHVRKSKITVSYPNAVLNRMVQTHFTNEQYHELTDVEKLTYSQRKENTIFFEVDGPYLAMVLPAAKEEGKKLKKRYAVFNFDGSLAELKGFEVKRRGELQIIKIFQSSVFESFLKGNTLEECYASVAKVADYWLDVLYTKGANIPDSELFELISENRSMSRKLEDYEGQKSTSISTAKRLAEFLGDQMVKDKGLACRFIISKKPEGAPVTERAIPLAIFQTDSSIKRHYLRKWLKDPTIMDLDIREVLDWNYYIERLGGTIQKIITIPAAMQGLANPVPRIRHPEWLHKKMLEKNDIWKQRRINELFSVKPRQNIVEDAIQDIEDTMNSPSVTNECRAIVTKRKRQYSENDETYETTDISNEKIAKTWCEALGPPPSKENLREWIIYQKKKWAWQAENRALISTKPIAKRTKASTATIGGFLKSTQRTLLNSPWQIIQIVETNEPGIFKLWGLVGNELHQIRLTVPRMFYVNQRKPKVCDENMYFKKCNRTLPRSQPVHYLYQFSVSEEQFLEHSENLMSQLSTPDVEGIYETQMSLEFRAILQLGCVCTVDKNHAKKLIQSGSMDVNAFSLNNLQICPLKQQPYLKRDPETNLHCIKNIYLYHNRAPNSAKAIFGLFLSPIKKALIIVMDTVRTNQMPNLNTMYIAERIVKLERGKEEHMLPPTGITFEVRMETDLHQVYKIIQRALQGYRDEKKGPTLLAVQTSSNLTALTSQMPELLSFPLIQIHIQDIESLYNTIEWQRVGARAMIRHYLNIESVVELSIEQCRYFFVPLGNLPQDPTIFGTDLYYARFLQKNNFVLWCSPTDRPDLGGREADDNRLLTEFDEGSSAVANNPGSYSTVCVELDVDSLAVNTLLQSHHVNDLEGTSSCVAFDNIPQVSLEEIIGSNIPPASLPVYDETALCAPAFKILRSMVNSWLRDITLYRNVFADFQIVHFYRWLRSPHALLYDPALRKTLHNLMKKLFVQLVAEFKRLGAVIIFANFNKIIICTKKKSVTDAISYVEYVVQNIRNIELFHSIEISYNQCWEYLMWLDLANHGGVRGKLPSGLNSAGEEENKISLSKMEENAENPVDSQTEKGEAEDDDNNGPVITMNWNLAEYLPEEAKCRSSFRNVIAAYINAVYEYMWSDPDRSLTQTPVRRRPSTSQSSYRPQLGLGAHKSASEFAKTLITGELSQKLFQIVEHIHRRLPMSKAASELSFAAQSNSLINPSLEFIKAVCKILSLDPSIEIEVMDLRKNMLKLIQVGAFSDDAEWKEPCISFTLPEVICKACNHCRDIDLCKDSFRTVENNDASWLCPLCKNSYDNVEIESMLIDCLNRKAMAYILQDLQCIRCKQIKMENIPKHCPCAGDYKTLINRNDLVLFLKTFHIIANYFQMPLLLELVEHNLKMQHSM